MRVCGIISEYDPFHKGHERQLRLAREKSQADYMICVMSGSFTQRGMPALFSAHDRAEMALSSGADLVLQLPYAFSVREAENFALGGIGILTGLGCVTHLSFGTEYDDLATLQKAARLLEKPDEALEADLRQGLNQGLSHAEAMGRALSDRLSLEHKILNAPNTALALSYLRALVRLKSNIQPIPILRTTHYHAAEAESYPSATAMRGAALRGDWAALEKGLPAGACQVAHRALAEGHTCPPQAMDVLLEYMLMNASPESLARLPGVSEGLEMRILKAAQKAVTRQELIRLIKTRRYTQGRISRALCHGVMQITKEMLPALPGYARILGFKKEAQPLLRQLQDSGFPLVTRPAREPLMAMDLKADELWHMMAGLPRENAYQCSPVILP
ncbi:MAG: nucleotidyltransferase family protein [Clostridiales bacterium]|nr:nucleotidyltransferase family protein [Clostridiales bacterium]